MSARPKAVLILCLQDARTPVKKTLLKLRAAFPHRVIWAIGPYQTEKAAEAIRFGASDYMTFPPQPGRLEKAPGRLEVGLSLESSWLDAVERYSKPSPEPQQTEVLETRLTDGSAARSTDRIHGEMTRAVQHVLDGVQRIGDTELVRPLARRGNELLFLGKSCRSGENLGVRVIAWSDRERFGQANDLLRAAEIGQDMRSPLFVPPVDVVLDTPQRVGAIVYPLLPLQPLAKELNGHTDSVVLASVLLSLAKAIRTLHTSGLAGVSLNPESIFVTSLWSVRLMDYGVPSGAGPYEPPLISDALRLRGPLTPAGDCRRWALLAYELLANLQTPLPYQTNRLNLASLEVLTPDGDRDIAIIVDSILAAKHDNDPDSLLAELEEDE